MRHSEADQLRLCSLDGERIHPHPGMLGSSSEPARDCPFSAAGALLHAREESRRAPVPTPLGGAPPLKSSFDEDALTLPMQPPHLLRTPPLVGARTTHSAPPPTPQSQIHRLVAGLASSSTSQEGSAPAIRTDGGAKRPLRRHRRREVRRSERASSAARPLSTSTGKSPHSQGRQEKGGSSDLAVPPLLVQARPCASPRPPTSLPYIEENSPFGLPKHRDSSQPLILTDPYVPRSSRVEDIRARLLDLLQHRLPTEASQEVKHRRLSIEKAAIEAREAGANPRSRSAEDTAWGPYCAFCQHYGFHPLPPLDTPVGELCSQLGTFAVWKYPQLEARGDVEWAKPGSALNHALSVRRCLGRHGWQVPSAKGIKSHMHSLYRSYCETYGPRAVAPTRKMPMTRHLWQQICELQPNQPRGSSKQARWSPETNQLQRTVLRLGAFLRRSGHRLGEICATPGACAPTSREQSSPSRSGEWQSRTLPQSCWTQLARGTASEWLRPSQRLTLLARSTAPSPLRSPSRATLTQLGRP